MCKVIFVTGGVVSSLGKGIVTASTGALLKARGYRVSLRKLDPYLNVDPGTMSPLQHGEVFVTEDGTETDLDLGHYERFTNNDAIGSESVTSGKIYSELIARERRGDYLGATVQVIPHVTDLLQEAILYDKNRYDFIICEIGGTVGDIESLPFIEAARQIQHKLGSNNVLFMHLTLVPFIKSASEFKSKPTQHSVKELMSLGIKADILICRCETELDEVLRNKIALFCNVGQECVFSCPDVTDIYEIPIFFANYGIDKMVLKKLGLTQVDTSLNLSNWNNYISKQKTAVKNVNVAIVGKYNECKDAYKSIIESLKHAAVANNVRLEIKWVNAKSASTMELKKSISEVDAIIVPGGFGFDGVVGKIEAIKYARENDVPFLGICLGMQLAIIEFARNVVGLESANSTEFDKDAEVKLIDFMSNWQTKDGNIERSVNDDKGGTMRLGSYISQILPGSLAEKLYKKSTITERHRHRYEVNINYKEDLSRHGLVFSGLSPDGLLPEIMEIREWKDKEGISHKLSFFLACQFHPELKSRPFTPHPLFHGLIEAIVSQ